MFLLHPILSVSDYYPAKPPQHAKSGLLSLSRELRNMIYAYVFEDTEVIIVSRCTHEATHMFGSPQRASEAFIKPEPNLLSTCHQIRDETMETFVTSIKTLTIDSLTCDQFCRTKRFSFCQDIKMSHHHYLQNLQSLEIAVEDQGWEARSRRFMPSLRQTTYYIERSQLWPPGEAGRKKRVVNHNYRLVVSNKTRS